MSSAIDVCNLALSHIGVGKEIAALDERSEEARACNRFYETARDEMLRGFVWPFARKIQALGLVSTVGDAIHPSLEWTYAYRYPSDCLMLRRIQSGVRMDYRQARVSYDTMADDVGTLILTDMQTAVLEYTSTVGQNPSRWQPDFVMSLSYRLAAYLAPRLAKGDPFKVGERAAQFYSMSIRVAKANAANEVQVDETPDGELILARR